MTSRVHLERDGDVAVVVIDNPPILDWLADVSGPGFVRGEMRHVLG